MSRHLCRGLELWLASMLILASLALPSFAGEAGDDRCAARVSEARYDLAVKREAERLAPIAASAQQAIFALIESLWEAKLTERLTYLSAKFERDRARLLVDREATARKRSEALLEVLRRECHAGGEDTASARADFEDLTCELVRLDRALAKTEAAHRSEELESTKELRTRELASAQELIQTKHALDSAKSKLASRSEQLRRCQNPETSD